MRRGAIDGARGSECAPSSGEGHLDFHPARTGGRPAGIPIPSGWLAGVITLAIIGLIALLSGEPEHPYPPRRLIPGAPGTLTFGFALSPDGQTIATTRSDGRLSLRDIRGLERILDPRGRAWWGLAFSPDSRFLAVARDEPGVSLFDLVAGGSRSILNMPLSRIKALAFSPDGRTLAATADRDARILLWDLVADRVRTTLRGRFPVLNIAFSPDGRSLASGERAEARVTLWDLETGRSRSIFRETSGAISSVAFSPDGSLLAAAAPADRVVRIWDAGSGRLRLQIAGHRGGTNAVRFSPDGGLLITSGSDGMVRIWKVETGEPIASLDGHSGHSPALPRLFLSAGGRVVAATGFNNDVLVWELDDIDEVRFHRAGKGMIQRGLVTSETPSEGAPTPIHYPAPPPEKGG